MKGRSQTIKSEETEEKELQEILHEVGNSLRERSARRNRDGLTYAEFRANMLKTQLKGTSSTRVGH